jgi:hypothetical protein
MKLTSVKFHEDPFSDFSEFHTHRPVYGNDEGNGCIFPTQRCEKPLYGINQLFFVIEYYVFYEVETEF